MIKIYLIGKSRMALQNAHTLNNLKVTMGAPWSAEFTPAKAGVALQTAPLNVCKIRLAVRLFARLASEHPVSSTGQAFEQPRSVQLSHVSVIENTYKETTLKNLDVVNYYLKGATFKSPVLLGNENYSKSNKLIATVGKSTSNRSGGFYCWAICVTFSFQGAFIYSIYLLLFKTWWLHVLFSTKV